MYTATLTAITEASLLSFEASRVIALRMQMMVTGGPAAWKEADLMVSEKNARLERPSVTYRPDHLMQRFAQTCELS